MDKAQTIPLPEDLRHAVAMIDIARVPPAARHRPLNDADRMRASSLSGSRRTLFLAARAATYEYLGHALNLPPASFDVVANGRVRPVLRRLPVDEAPGFRVANIGVSFSYAQDRALVGIGFECRVGIDIEARSGKCDRQRNVSAIRAEYFSETVGRDGAASLSPSDADFHRQWVRHEALHKLVGKGLSFPADDVAARYPDVTVNDFDVGEAHTAAVAVDGPGQMLASPITAPGRITPSGCKAFLLYPEQ